MVFSPFFEKYLVGTIPLGFVRVNRKLLIPSSSWLCLLLSQEMGLYPPKRCPSLLLITTMLSPLRSHNEWKVSASNPSFDPLQHNFHAKGCALYGNQSITTPCCVDVNKEQSSNDWGNCAIPGTRKSVNGIVKLLPTLCTPTSMDPSEEISLIISPQSNFETTIGSSHGVS